MKKIIIFNWKSKPATEKEVVHLLSILKKHPIEKVKIIICPPFIFLNIVKNIIKKNWRKGCFLGAQNVFWLDRVNATGEITPQMLKKLGVKYVIIGHSERRELLREDGEMINAKIKASLRHSLVPIVCIGEKQRRKKEFDMQTKRILLNQLNPAFRGIQIQPFQKIMIAYEPVWAIGKKESDDFSDVQEVLSFIRLWLKKRFSEKVASQTALIYGGSVKSNNIKEFLKIKNLNGLLIGSASTKTTELNRLLRVLNTK